MRGTGLDSPLWFPNWGRPFAALAFFLACVALVATGLWG